MSRMSKINGYVETDKKSVDEMLEHEEQTRLESELFPQSSASSRDEIISELLHITQGHTIDD